MSIVRKWSGDSVGGADNAFDTSTGTITSDAGSARAPRLKFAPSAATAIVNWGALALTEDGTLSMRLNLETAPSATMQLIVPLDSVGSPAWRIYMQTSGALRVTGPTGTTLASGAVPLTLGTDYRVQVRASETQVDCELYSASGTLLEAITGEGTFGDVNNIRLGSITSNTAVFYLDDIAYSDENEDLGDWWFDTEPPPAPRVAVIGDSVTYQDGDGEDAIRARLQASGWSEDSIYFYAVGGKAITAEDSGGKTTLENVADAKAQLGTVDQWLIALGTNNVADDDSTFIAAIESVIDEIDGEGEILWVGLGFKGASNSNAAHFNPLLQETVEGNGQQYLDWNSFIHNGRDETGLWSDSDSTHMTEAGYEIRNDFYVARLKGLSGMLPSNVGSGTVTGKIIDDNGAPLAGSVTFTPSAKKLLDVDASGGPVTIIPTVHSVTLDSSGSFSKAMMATDDSDLNPVNWTYKVTFTLVGAKMDAFSISVPQGVTTDLSAVAPVGSSGGASIVRGPGVPGGGLSGQVLRKKSDSDDDTEWATVAFASPSTLNDLTDVDTTGAEDGQTLIYDADELEWVPGAVVTEVAWTSVSNKPTTFAPSTHSHATSEVTGLDVILEDLGELVNDKANTEDLAEVASSGSYDDLEDKPNIAGGAREEYVRFFSEFEGASDDAKLDAFMTWAKAETPNKGSTLVLDENRVYTFTTSHELYSGFSIRGSLRPQDQARASKPIANQVSLGSNTSLFTLPSGNTYGVSITNLSIDGATGSRLVEGRSNGVLWTSTFRDISFQNGANVLGSKANKLLVTSCSVEGWWNVNNIRECGFVLGGSDFFFKPTELNLDSPPTMLAENEYLFRCENLSNFFIEGMYLTSEGHSAMLLDGGTSDESAWIHHNHIEGRNEDETCPGALIRIDGGQYILHDNRFAFAMTDPEATGRDDGGAIHVVAGTVMVDRCTYRRADGVGEDVPFLYATGGKTVVRNIVGQGFTGKPVVYQSVDGLIDADDSVTLVTPTAPEVAEEDTQTVSGTSGTTIVVNKPTNVANGDLLVAAIWGRNNDVPYTAPSGWTEHAPVSGSDAVGVIRFYSKPVPTASSETATDYTWSAGSSGRKTGAIMRVTGADLDDPVAAASALATGQITPSRVIIPSLTAEAPATLLLMFAASNITGGIGGDVYQADEVTMIANVTTATGSTESSSTVGAKVVAAGSTGTTSYQSKKISDGTAVPSGNYSSSIGYAIAINPA